MSMYSAYLSDEEMEAICSEEQMIQNMLQLEIALAKAQSKLGIISEKAAIEIESVLKKMEIKPKDLSEGTLKNGISTIPLLAEVKKYLSDEASGVLHFGTTSQDLYKVYKVITQISDIFLEKHYGKKTTWGPRIYPRANQSAV